jgi:hypothetical protein
MTKESFIRRYRVAVLGGMLAWRLVLFNPFAARGAYDALAGLVYGIGLGLLPATALAALAGRIRTRGVLVVAALAVFAADAAALAVARWSPSSTASVAVMLAPLFSLVTIVPAAALAGLVSRRGDARQTPAA